MEFFGEVLDLGFEEGICFYREPSGAEVCEAFSTGFGPEVTILEQQLHENVFVDRLYRHPVDLAAALGLPGSPAALRGIGRTNPRFCSRRRVSRPRRDRPRCE